MSFNVLAMEPTRNLPAAPPDRAEVGAASQALISAVLWVA
jgi:hypothetical protein